GALGSALKPGRSGVAPFRSGRFYEVVGRPSKIFCELFIFARQTQIAVPQLVVIVDHRGPLAKPFRFLSIPTRVGSRCHGGTASVPVRGSHPTLARPRVDRPFCRGKVPPLGWPPCSR